MTNADLPASLVTVTGCGSSGARSLVGTSCMGVRSFGRGSAQMAEAVAQFAENAERVAQFLVGGQRLQGGVAAHLRLGLAVVLGKLAPGIGAGIALPHALAEEIEAPQPELAFRLAPF